MAEYIYISLKGKKFNVKRDLTVEEKKNAWRKQKTITEKLDYAPARIISPRLAVYKEENGNQYRSALWHVIHIPTGLVIAACDNDIIKDVKATFESSEWTLKGADTLVMYNGRFEFEMTCNIRYDIKEIE
jgi:hypothetical protein